MELLQKVKARIAELDHWTDKQETKADIGYLIRDTPWNGLPECYDELSISGYRQRIYEYVYTRYLDIKTLRKICSIRCTQILLCLNKEERSIIRHPNFPIRSPVRLSSGG